MSEEKTDQQLTLDRTMIFNRLVDLKEHLEKLEERVVEAEVTLDTLSAGHSIICSALENAGLMKGGEPMQPAWDPAKIKWVQAEGTKGPYSRYPAQGEKAEATDNYRNMLADIKQHDGKMMRDNQFYWVFQDGATVGRKRKGKSQGEPRQEGSSSIQGVRAKFPQDLEELLNFSVEDNNIIIKPRRFLGSENFSKVAAIVRDARGEYISAGKESHFRIPRKGRSKAV